MKPGKRDLPLDQGMPGMCLAEDLRDGHGNVLLKAGTQLGAAHLASLAQRGVRSIAIVEPVSAAELEAAREAARARLAHLFRQRRGEPDQLLYQTLLEYRLEQLQ